MHYIHKSETDNILRVATNLINSQNIEDTKNDHPQKISSKYVKMSRKNLNERYISKEMHDFKLRQTIIATQKRAIREQLIKI